MNKQFEGQIRYKEQIFLDFLSFILTYLPGILSYTLSFEILFSCIPFVGRTITFLLFPVLSVIIYIFICLCFYLVLPKLKPGKFKLGINKGMFAWCCHLALNRSSKVLGLRYLINSFFIFKYLHLISLGAKVSFVLRTSMDYIFVDLPLLKIGANCSFGQNVYISCHLIKDNHLHLIPVSIGDNVDVGMNCNIGPGSRIGSNCKIEYGNNIYGSRIKDNTKIKGHEWLHGPPSAGHSN